MSSYDEIAGLYNICWARAYLPAALPALQKLFFAHFGSHAKVLDLCCGSGHITEELVRRGFQVTGVDNSAKLIELAQRRLPQVEFHVQDARRLKLNRTFHGVLSTYDSLNHMLSIEDLIMVFAGVKQLLKPGGRFVFDMNLEQAYSLDLRQWTVDIGDANVGLVRGLYDSFAHLARTEVIWFSKQKGRDCWRRRRTVVEERCYPQFQITGALLDMGFQDVEAIPAPEAGVTGDLGFGRVFFVARSS